MKLSIWLISSLVFCLGCRHQPSKANENIRIEIADECSMGYDSTLLELAEEFKPSRVELDSSISLRLDTFLVKIDTNCLRKQKNYQLFICIILSKLYYSQLLCCNQSYDLLSMKGGAAGVIINEFEKIAGYQNRRLEMLSSSTIVEFVERNKELSSNSLLREIVGKIRNEEHRISRGNI